MKNKSVLVVDDQKLFREAVAFEMEMLGFEVTLAEDGKQGFQHARSKDFSLIISDIRMPNWDGIKFLQEFRKISPDFPPFVLMTGFADIRPQDAYSMGADALLGKPLNPIQFNNLIEHLLLSSEKQLATEPLESVQQELNGRSERVEVARRGFFIGGDVDLIKIKVGAIVSYNFKNLGDMIPGGHLKGTGVIRWVRNHEEEGALPGVGVEILNLVEPTPESFVKFAKSTGLIAAIPRGSRKLKFGQVV